MTAITTTESVSHKTTSSEQPDVFAAKKSVLRIRDLRKTFGGQVVLDGASAELREGEVVLLRGNNGSGKTTLLNILSGNLEPDGGSIHLQVNGASEHFKFPRRWWENLNPFDHFTPERVAREGVGRTWQDVRLFNSMTLAENIAVASPRQAGENPLNVLLRRGRMRREERYNREATSSRLRGLGLGDRENSSADRISLGQTKRVAIARAVQAGARILFLDEPLAGLDAQGIDYVLELLRELVREHRVTLVIVEHVFNIPRVLDLADTVWTLRDGKITIESSTIVRGQSPKSCGTDIITWLAKLLGPQTSITQESLAGGATLWKLRTQGADSRNGEPPLLEVRDLVVHRGNRLVIGKKDSPKATEGFSFNIADKEIAVLQAPNGWGKTTLADAIAGIIPVVGGQVRFRGSSIEHLPTWERSHRKVGFVPSRNCLFPSLSANECRKLAGRDGIKESPGFSLNRPIGSLSGGERQQTVLEMARPTELGIYDEPFSALDENLVGQSFRRITALGHNAILILLPHA